MNPKELYEKYKGKVGTYTYRNSDEPPSRGIVVGYTYEHGKDDTPLIMKVINGGYG